MASRLPKKKPSFSRRYYVRLLEIVAARLPDVDARILLDAADGDPDFTSNFIGVLAEELVRRGISKPQVNSPVKPTKEKKHGPTKRSVRR